MKRKIPHDVIPYAMLGCWIVGSGANPDTDKPNDWDIMVPYRLWPQVAAIIPSEAKPNRFGGWKYQAKETEIDVWPDDLDRLMSEHVVGQEMWLWHPKSGIHFKRVL